MRRILEELRETMAEFAEQPSWPLLVIRAADSECGLVLNALEAVEAQNDVDLFFRFSHPMDDAERWSIKAFTTLKLTIEAANQKNIEGAPLLPTAPERLMDVRRPLAERWGEAVRFMADLNPNNREHRLVIAALPTLIPSHPEHARLVGMLATIAHELPHVRLIVRDPREAPPESNLLQTLRRSGARALQFDLDLSTAALLDGLVTDAADPATPTLQRMTALLQLAFLDFAHRRYEDAMAKFGRICTFCVIEKNPTLHAMALYGAAQTMEKITRDLGMVKERYQQAMALAIEAQAYPILLELLFAVVPICVQTEDLESAHSYADSAKQLAHGLLQPGRSAQALCMRGDVELAMKRYPEARASWEEADSVAEKAADPDVRREALGRLLELFKTARMARETQTIEARIASLPPSEHAA